MITEVIARELFTFEPQEGLMDTTGWMMAQWETPEILRRQSRYNWVKESVTTSLANYMEVVKSEISIQNLIKQSSALRFEVSYCDETYMIDCSNICIVENKFYACIEAYKQQRELGGNEIKPKYLKLFSSLYTDGERVYELKDDRLEGQGMEFINGINSFVMFVLSKAFE